MNRLPVSALAWAILLPATSANAQSTYLSGQDAETFRALEVSYDPEAVGTARAHFESLERLLNNHAPIEDVVTGLRDHAAGMLEELITVDQGCSLFLLGRMTEVTAEELQERAATGPTAELLADAGTDLLRSAAQTYRSAAAEEASVCFEPAREASRRLPSPEPEPSGEPVHVFGAMGGFAAPEEGSGE